ncbi:hypothetical protein BWQ96_07143 [Gracilariopsis chorda]|uniref:Uncharacterized protein n=1 Tax=Gracilariopsis chorda TaxID=448386 RepID=A0A2V3IM20_9FLOR|nr:hypothetical protein BWQ96_07143 [Gracilariopsis chorda]|eukprot:PXF43109.1 hypothetical protein BWQ96_07143 [Gracilariopsis chorda]
MAERLHYFTEASTPVSFDCDDSDIDSDLDDLSRRPQSDSDRAKIHARQLQLWSDEARRRLSGQPPSTPPQRRSTFSGSLSPNLIPIHLQPTTLSTDRQQSNLSERSRPSQRVSRSHSAKNLRIRITPSSSSKSLLSDIESESGHPLSAPQSPRRNTLTDVRLPSANKPLPPSCVPPTSAPKNPRAAPAVNKQHNAKPQPSAAHSCSPVTHAAPAYSPPETKLDANPSDVDEQDHATVRLSTRHSFSRRIRRWSLRRLFSFSRS